MKNRLALALAGKNWWKPFLCFVSASLGALILLEISCMRFFTKPTLQDHVISVCCTTAALMLLLIANGFFFYFIWSRTVTATEYKGKSFQFKSDFPDFAGLLLKGCVLSVITLGLYAPRFIKLIVEFLGRKTSYDGKRILFTGSAEKLFKKFIPGGLAPIALFLILSALVSSLIGSALPRDAFSPQGFALQFALLIALGISLSPFLCFFADWLVNFHWKDCIIRLEVDSKAASLFIAGQTVLTICSFGLYLPAALITTWKYFSEKMVIIEEKKNVAGFFFEGKPVTGFFFIWGQCLLSIVSFGIYTPWACARIQRYFICNTGTSAV